MRQHCSDGKERISDIERVVSIPLFERNIFQSCVTLAEASNANHRIYDPKFIHHRCHCTFNERFFCQVDFMVGDAFGLFSRIFKQRPDSLAVSAGPVEHRYLASFA